MDAIAVHGLEKRYVAHLPGATLRPLPVFALVAVASALTAAGLAGFRRRDVG